MSIGIATLGMFGSQSGAETVLNITPPLEVSVNNVSLTSELQKVNISTSVSSTSLTTTTKNMKLAINLNSDELELEVKET